MNTAKNKEQEPHPNSKFKGNWVNIVDALAKVIGAAAVVVVAVVAHNFESTLSATSLINQREQAETNLRATLLHDLITTVTDQAGEKKPLNITREEVLVKLLTLNFHDHFEFKPLLINLDQRLTATGNTAGRQSLQSVSRRVVDRQISRLLAVGLEMGNHAKSVDVMINTPFADTVATAATGGPTSSDSISSTAKLRLRNCDQVAYSDDHPSDTVAVADDSGDRLMINSAIHPASESRTVCVLSPDNQYYLGVMLLDFNTVSDNAFVSVTVQSVDRTREIPRKFFYISPYDFPLTDNTRIDSFRRYALSLYLVPDKQNNLMDIKVVWFPKGYITERERPVNYEELRKFLHLDDQSNSFGKNNSYHDIWQVPMREEI